MRTTVDIPEHLLAEAKRLAVARKTSLTKIVEDGLRKYLADARASAGRKRATRLPTIDAGVASPDIDLDDTSSLWEL